MSIGATNSRALRSEATRKQLLAAAARSVAREGYQATRLDDVAAAIGMTKGAVYSHFPSKHALLRAVLEQHTREQALAESFERVMTGESEPDPEFVLLFVELWCFALRTGEGKELLAQALSEARPRISRLLAERGRAADDVTVSMLLAADLGMAMHLLLEESDVPTASARELVDRVAPRTANASGDAA